MSKKREYDNFTMILRIAPFLIVGLPLTALFFPLGIVVLIAGFWFAGF